MSLYCEKCGLTKDEKEFYTSNNTEKYPSGKLNICKKCATMFVDNWDPETYKPLLEDLDVPYVKDEWDKLLIKWGEDPKKLTGMTIIGKYLSKMKLKQWKDKRWADSEAIAEKLRNEKIAAMRAQGFTGEEIEEQLAMNRVPEKPKELAAPGQESPVFSDTLDNEHDDFDDNLTEEDKIMLRVKWGRGYRVDEWVRMEQFYHDIMNSYDIQGATQKDTVIMICKASLRANQLIDAGDIEGFQKAQKSYNDLLKSSNLSAAQIKEKEKEGIDSVGELVAMCEKDGFIPRYYVDEPKDKVDRVIQDMQKYTRDLVTEELGLGNLIENAVQNIQREQDRIRAAGENAEDIESREEEEMFKYDNGELTDQDHIDFAQAQEEGLV